MNVNEFKLVGAVRLHPVGGKIHTLPIELSYKIARFLPLEYLKTAV